MPGSRPNLRAPGLQQNTLPSLESLVQEMPFQKEIMDMARDAGWLVHHNFDSRKSAGVGFPDLVLVRAPHLVFAELKKVGRYPTRAQRDWLEALAHVTDLHVRTWRPTDADWREIEATLWTPRNEELRMP